MNLFTANVRVGPLVLLLALACSPAAEERTVHDLTTLIERAESRAETSSLDFGSPQARAAMLSGWSYNEHDQASGEGFVWGVAPASTLTFELAWVRDLEIEFRGRAPRQASSTPLRVTVLVNDSEVTVWTLGPRRRAYRTVLPAKALRRGRNTINLSYEGGLPDIADWPAREGSPLAGAWFSARFGDGEAPGPAGVIDSSELRLPFGVRLDYHLRVPPTSALRFAGIDGPGRLEVEIHSDAEATPWKTTFGPGDDPAPLPISGETGSILRVTLAAVPNAGAGARNDGLRVLVPRISTLEPPSEIAAVALTPPPATPPHVIIYLVDTLRADHLGAYGYSRPVSPEIDRFAVEATLYEHAVAQSSWTRPTVASVFTGLWPHVHGVNSPRSKLPETAPTLAEVLRSAGYRTAGFVTNPNVSESTGLARGFEHFEFLEKEGNNDWTRADEINKAVFRWLDAETAGSPMFLYVHTMDPHDPYDPTPEMRERFAPGVADDAPTRPMGRHARDPDELAELVALYDAEIAFNDRHFGVFLERLRNLDLYDNAMVVFLSDHGEEFYEHGGWKHGATLHAESIDVPLIVKYPHATSGSRVAARAQQIDLLPTVLDLLGLEPLAGLPGASLRTLESPAVGERQIVSYLDRNRRPQAALLEATRKLLLRRPGTSQERASLFDLGVDRGERDDLADRRPVTVGYLAAELRFLLAARGLDPEEAELSERLEEQLRALGYLN